MSLQANTTAPKKVSLVHLYAPVSAIKKRRKDRVQPRVQPITVDDPWAQGEPAVQRAAPNGAEADNGTAREWIAPEKRPIEVLCSRRDVIAGMYARGQIDKAMFLAARNYQTIYETAMSLSVRGVDPSAPVVSGGTGKDMVDAVAQAAGRLARIEKRLGRRYGAGAVTLVRDVLGDGLTIDRATKRRGDGIDEDRVRWWGGMLRRSLKEVAEICGYAVRGAYANRQREEKRIEDARTRQDRKDRERKPRGKRRQQPA